MISGQTELAIKIIVHVSKSGAPREDGMGRPEASQRGIAAAVGCTQGAASKILARLIAVEMVRSDRRRVTGMGRRVRVYSLTFSGYFLAKEILESTYATNGHA